MIKNIICAVTSMYEMMLTHVVLNPRWWLATTIGLGVGFLILTVLQKKGIIKDEV